MPEIFEESFQFLLERRGDKTDGLNKVYKIRTKDREHKGDLYTETHIYPMSSASKKYSLDILPPWLCETTVDIVTDGESRGISQALSMNLQYLKASAWHLTEIKASLISALYVFAECQCPGPWIISLHVALFLCLAQFL